MREQLFPQLKQHDRKVFNKNFLFRVHAEICFNEIPSEVFQDLDKVLSAVFEERSFTSCENIIHGEYVIQHDDKNMPAELKQEEHKHIGFKFSTEHGERIIDLHNDRLLVTINLYEGFEAFTTDLEAITKALEGAVGKLTISKTGLRKVDLIKVGPVDDLVQACNAFSPNLFGMLRSGLASLENFNVSEEAMVFKSKDKTCLIRTIFKKASPDKYFDVTLDFDLVDTATHSLEQTLEQVLPNLNELHFDLFMWAVTKELVSIMEE